MSGDLTPEDLKNIDNFNDEREKEAVQKIKESLPQFEEEEEEEMIPEFDEPPCTPALLTEEDVEAIEEYLREREEQNKK